MDCAHGIVQRRDSYLGVAMGHRRKSTIYKLTFDESHGEELAGLEVVARGASLGQLFDIAKLGNVDLLALLETGIDELRGIYEGFPSRLIDWNHEDEEGRPVSATAENFFDEDYSLTLPIVVAWVNTIRADPKNAETIGLKRTIESDGRAPEDLSDLPMSITQA